MPGSALFAVALAGVWGISAEESGEIILHQWWVVLRTRGCTRENRHLELAPMLEFWAFHRQIASAMAGHSKWANIQHRKGRQDERRGKLFTRLIKEITVAAKMGGADTSVNPRLRLAMDKASDANMPKDTVSKAVQRGAGQIEGADYSEIRYEGYGIGGAAVIVDCLTDNRTRTVAEVRHAFSKHGGNLGTDGSVAFLFRHCGQFLFAPGTASEDRLMEIAIDAGADDVIPDDEGGIEILCKPAVFSAVREALKAAALHAEIAALTMRPETEIVLTGDDAARMQKLLDVLENLDDVQEIYTNAALDGAAS